jgi:hypothetical protein
VLWYSTPCLFPLSLLCLPQPPASFVLESRMGAMAAPTSLTSASPAPASPLSLHRALVLDLASPTPTYPQHLRASSSAPYR